jgi:hypothetical protein
MNQFNAMSHHNFRALSGVDIVRMMRGTRVTIRQLAESNQITMRRVRELRTSGVPGGLAAWEIFSMLRSAQLAS